MQKKTFSTVLAIALSAAVLMLAGCGGSGGSASPTVSGIAATGKAIVGNVRLKDSSTPSRELTAATGTDGSYVVNVAGLTPPFLVRADWTTAEGTQSLVSFAAAPGTANINPISNIIVANAAGVSDPVALFENPTADVRAKIVASIAAATAEFQSKLDPLIKQYAGANIDPIKGAFAANHTGLDAMLDAVKIGLSGGTVTVASSASGTMIFTSPITNFAQGTMNSGSTPPPPPSQAQPTPDGTALYAANCAGCHGSLAKTNKPGASVARIQSAITAGSGGMGYLSSMSSQEIQAIATVLGTPATPTAPAAPSPAPVPVPAPAPSTTADGAALYATNCGGCHGPLATSTKKGMTATRLQTAVSGNIGGMGFLSTLTAAENQAIVDALASSPAPSPAPAPSPSPAPSPTPAPADGATLYATNCAGCHGALAASTKKGMTLARLQSGISGNIGGMGYLSTLTSTEQQAIVGALAVTTPAPAPAPTPAPTPAPVPAPIDAASLYATNCANCHGTLANSTKKGITLARLQSSISGNAGGMGVLSSLSSAEQQAIVNVLAVVTPAPAPAPTPAPVDGATLYGTKCAGCHGVLATTNKPGTTLARLDAAISGNAGGMGTLSSLTAAEKQAIVDVLVVTTPTPVPTPTPTPAPVDGAALYGTSCAGCHGPLASSTKAGATATRTQTAINGNVGGMGYLSTLTAAQVQAIATALATVTPPTTPAPTPACGSCHALPPSTGQHSKHLSQRVACATCHGTGYSTTAVNAATHNNGVKNVGGTSGWNATTRSCSNSCHGTERW